MISNELTEEVYNERLNLLEEEKTEALLMVCPITKKNCIGEQCSAWVKFNNYNMCTCGCDYLHHISLIDELINAEKQSSEHLESISLDISNTLPVLEQIVNGLDRQNELLQFIAEESARR